MYAGMLKGDNSIWFNGQPYHIGATALADWMGAKLRELTGEQGQVTISNHPLDTEARHSPIQTMANSSKNFLSPGCPGISPALGDGTYFQLNHFRSFAVRLLGVIVMSLVFSYVSCSLIITPVQERVRKSKLVRIILIFEVAIQG